MPKGSGRLRDMIQQVLMRSYAIARQSGLWSSVTGGALFYHAYCLYKRLLEREQSRLIRRLARSGSLVVDIGANIGYFTIIMAEAVGDRGAVLAFEPDAQNLRLMRRAVLRSGFTNVTVVPAAVGERTGSALLYVNPDHPGDHRIYPIDTHRKCQEVPLCSLDDYLERTDQMWELSVIKIDVQGAELRVLRGMEKTLRRYPSACLLLEFDPQILRQAGTDPQDLVSFVDALGFRPFLLGGEAGIFASSWSQIEGLLGVGQYADVLLSRERVAGQ